MVHYSLGKKKKLIMGNTCICNLNGHSAYPHKTHQIRFIVNLLWIASYMSMKFCQKTIRVAKLYMHTKGEK